MSSLPAETQDGVFAVPTDFEKGRALLIVYLDSKDKTPEFALGRIRNLGVLKDGTTEIIWLVPLKDKTPGGQSNLGNRQKQRAMERAESAVSAPADIADPQTPELEPKKSVPPS